MAFPYRIATLIYAFDDDDRALLLKRAKHPNQNLWSPSGGKLDTASGESPHMCAAREAHEELGIHASAADFKLTGIISEHGYLGETNWLMFLFEYVPRLKQTPPPCDEGEFGFFSRQEIESLPIPKTDKEQIWPLFWQYRGGFFMAHCHCSENGDRWTIEQTIPVS